MHRPAMIALALSAVAAGSVAAGPLSISPDGSRAFPRPPAIEEAHDPRYATGPDLGGGFIEFLFGGGRSRPAPYAEPYRPDPQLRQTRGEPVELSDPARPTMDPRFRRQVVDYDGAEKAG